MADTATTPSRWRRLLGGLGRWGRPSVLGLVVLAFALPFLTVSCETPGGFGRVAAGGTTTWTGFDLATGSDPDRTVDHLLPADRAAPDAIGPVPVVTLALALVVAAIVCALVIGRLQRRRYVVAVLAATASIVLTVGVVTARARIVGLVTEQLSGRTVPADRSPDDYVGLGQGYVLVMIGLWVVILADVVGWLLGRRRRDRRGSRGGGAVVS